MDIILDSYILHLFTKSQWLTLHMHHIKLCFSFNLVMPQHVDFDHKFTRTSLNDKMPYSINYQPTANCKASPFKSPTQARFLKKNQ